MIMFYTNTCSRRYCCTQCDQLYSLRSTSTSSWTVSCCLL